MPEELNTIKARCDKYLCPECKGRGSLPDRPGYFVLCACADGLSLAGEEASHGQSLRDCVALIAEVERLRTALDAILNIVSPENDPPDEAFTVDGIVANVRQLAELQATTQRALNAERELCNRYRAKCADGPDSFEGSRLCGDVDNDDWDETCIWPKYARPCPACADHDARRAAEAKEAT